jgi:hypothetical protein
VRRAGRREPRQLPFAFWEGQMRSRVLLSCLLLAGVACQVVAQTSSALVRKSEKAEVYRAAENPFVPVWSGYGLIGVRMNRTSKPTVWVSSSSGIEDIQFSIPGGEQLIIWSVAASQDHTITIGGLAVGTESRGSGFIGVIPPDRGKKLIVRTAPYFPLAITVAPDGVIWSVGWDDEGGRRAYNVVKRFSQSGILLSSKNMLVSAVPSGPDPDVSDSSHLHCSSDRVGWLTRAGQYLEFSFDGKEIGRFEAPLLRQEKQNSFVLPNYFFLALSVDNEVVVEGQAANSHTDSLWRLDRSTRQWIPANVTGEQVGGAAWLLGFDGAEIVVDTVTSSRGEVVAHLSFSPGS